MAEYTDLVVRQALTQSRAVHLVGPSSPDLIPHAEVADPEASFATAASYTSDPGGDLGASPLAYVRAAALTDGGTPIDAKLYLGVAAPTAMLWPDQLAWFETVGGNRFAEIAVAPGKIGVSTDPFDTGGADPGGTLGGYVWTVQDKVTIKRQPSLPALRDWLLATPGFAQRGTLILPDCAAGYAYDCTYEHRVVDGGANRVVFRLEWDRMPAGWTVALDGEHGIGLPETAASGSMGIAQELKLADNFTAKLRWRVRGTTVAADMQLRLMVYLVETLNGNDVWYPLGARALRPKP